MVDNYSKDEIDLKIVSQEHRLIRILLNLYNYRGDKVLFFASLKALLWCIFGSRTIGITIVGLLTLFFANKANDLLQKQNYLVESARRNTLVIEFSEVMNQLQKEYNSIDTTSGELSDLLLARIKSLSNSYKPYKYLDMNGELVESPISPERGQLLLTLLDADKAKKLLNSFLYQCNFQFSDFSGRSKLSDYAFNDLDLRSSDWSNCNVDRVTFRKTNLTQGDFENAKLHSVDFADAILVHLNLKGSRLHDINFSEARMKGVDLENAEVSSSMLPEISSLTFGNEKNETSNIENLICIFCYVQDKNWIDQLKANRRKFNGVDQFIIRHKLIEIPVTSIVVAQRKFKQAYKIVLKNPREVLKKK